MKKRTTDIGFPLARGAAGSEGERAVAGGCRRDGTAKRSAIGKKDYIQPGKPIQNAYVERKNGSMRRELPDAYAFDTLREARALTAQYQWDYNHERPTKRWATSRRFFTHKSTATSQIANRQPMKALWPYPYPQIRVGRRRRSKPAVKRRIVDKVFNELIMKLYF